MKKETKAIHAGTQLSHEDAGVNTPIFPSTAHRYISGDEMGYPRYLTTTNQLVVCDKMAALENTEDALVFGSGLAAIGHTLLTFLNKGDVLWVQEDIYGGTRKFIQNQLIPRGVQVEWFEIGHFPENSTPKMIYFETPTNPVVRIQSIPDVVAKAKEVGAITMIDNTFATPINQRPAEFGVDLIAHSGTKYLGGHSDLIFGVVCGRKDLLDMVRPLHIELGSCVNGNTAWMIERSLKTLAVRMERHNENALFLAESLEKLDFAKNVSYPGLASAPSHAIAQAQMDGYSGILSFDVAGASLDDYVRNLRMILPAVSLGGVESLLSIPTRSSHKGIDPAALHRMGITEQTVRISVGIEHKEDLLEDLKNAFFSL